MASQPNRRLFELLREQRLREAREDFLSYRKLINPKAKWGWWQSEVAGVLQEFYKELQAGNRPKFVIQAPPQHGKSVQVIDFLSWLAGKMPDKRAIYTSFSERLGVRANLRMRRILDSEMYGEVFPETKLSKPGVPQASGQYIRNSEILEYVNHEGYFRNTTVRGAITGESLDVGVIDDPIRGRSDANSETVRDATWDWFTDDFFTRFSDDAGLLAILTRWHVDDPIGRLIERDPSVKVFSYPALAEEDEPHRKKGEALFPEHKSAAFLLERKRVMSESNWLALYQQRPTNAQGSVFKPDMLRVVDAIPAMPIEWVRGWDLGATDGDGDYTAGPKLGRLPDGRFIIADVVRGQWASHDRDYAMHNAAMLDGYGVRISIPQDPGAAGKVQVVALVKLLAGFPVVWSPESGDKVTRAEPLAAQVNVGNVLMLRGSWNRDLIEEMRSFPNGKNDDQVDGLSRAFSEFLGNGQESAIYGKTRN